MLRFARRLGAALAVIGCAAIAAAPAQATFPGANGKIVFSKAGDLWTINPDGSDLTQITSGLDFDTGAKWSPDGAAIAFQRSPGSNSCCPYFGYDGADIFILRDGNLHEFGTYPADDFTPAWSPDGRRLAYATERKVFLVPEIQPVDLMTANLDGTDKQVVLHANFGWFPDWSPLGDRIAFSYMQDVVSAVFTINTDGSDKEAIVPPPGGDPEFGDGDCCASWSPDGTKLALGRHRPSEFCHPIPGGQECGHNSYVAVMNADGSDAQRLGPDPPVDDGVPVWSPDGTKIAFDRFADGQIGIYLMSAEGADPQFLAEGRQPDWQPLIAPRHLDPPRVLGAPREGRSFAANHGQWLGTPTVAYAYQWALCDEAGQNCADIAGATDRVYTPTHDDVAHTLQVKVTATNDYGQGDGTSEISAPVGESIAGTPTGESLVGTPGSDLVFGLGGPDRIALAGGNDVGQGGYGNDWIAGGDGNDFLTGGPGRDRLRGGSGRDRIYARDGYRDWISCGPGRDLVRADRRDRVASSCELVRYG